MKELPDGYVRVSVLVTEAEYKRLEKIATVTPRKTLSEAVRYTMGWTYVPHGFLQAVGITGRQRREPFHVRRPSRIK